MAVMSTKKTGTNITSWEYYIVGKKDWNRYENILLVETQSSTSIFTDTQGKNTSKEVFSDKTPIKLLKNESYNINGKVHAKVQIGRVTGFLPINKLSKPPRNTTEKEDIALQNLNEAIAERNTGKKGVCVLVKNKGKVVFTFMDVIGGRTFKGTPKADFSLINSKKQEVCFISHKDGGGAKAYQQYVSLTGGAQDNVNQHPIVKDFLSRLTMELDEITKYKKRPMRIIPFNSIVGISLMNYSIWGNDYIKNRNFGKEHCNFIAQGTPKLIEANPRDKPKDCGIAYELQFSEGIEISGDVSHFKTGGYEPVIFGRYSSNRKFYVNNVTYNDVRILIAPKILVGSSGYEV